MPLISYDKAVRAKLSIDYLCGVDEAGRGPLAGPVCAAAVILPADFEGQGINDSKKLSEKKRESLYDIITATALAWSVVFVDVDAIEELNILGATMLAMTQAVQTLAITPQQVLIDGNALPKNLDNATTLINGDAISASIAAASIIAKVTRDRYMKELELVYPGYGFAKHKGYGTKAHYKAIEELGICDIHRRSFLKKLIK